MRLLFPNIPKKYEEIGMMKRKYRVGKEGKAKKSRGPHMAKYTERILYAEVVRALQY